MFMDDESNVKEFIGGESDSDEMKCFFFFAMCTRIFRDFSLFFSPPPQKKKKKKSKQTNKQTNIIKSVSQSGLSSAPRHILFNSSVVIIYSIR